jgi:hypothetical protein
LLGVGRLIILCIASGAFALGAVPAMAHVGDHEGVDIEPYRWLDPPPGQSGDAQGASATSPVIAGRSPLVAFATPEEPPQAQVFAPPGALILPAGTTSLVMSITPIPPPAAPPNGRIAGNVYRISVATQDGVSASAPADAFVSVVMRGPDDSSEATINRFADGRWQPLETSSAGYTSGFLAIVTEFGDFALVADGASPTTEPGPTPSPPTSNAAPLGGIPPVYLAVGVAAAPLVLAVVAFRFYRSNRAQRPPPTRERRGRKR